MANGTSLDNRDYWTANSEKMIPVHCPLCCDEPFEDQQALFFHLRGFRNHLFCPICSERFSTLELLVKHLSRKCHGPKSPMKSKGNFTSSSMNDLNMSSSSQENAVDEPFNNDSGHEKVEAGDDGFKPTFKCIAGPGDSERLKMDQTNKSTNGEFSPDVTAAENSMKINTSVSKKSMTKVPSNSNEPAGTITPETNSILIKPNPLSYKLAALSKEKADKTKSGNVISNGEDSKTGKAKTTSDNQVDNGSGTLELSSSPPKIIGTSPLKSSFFTQGVAGKKRSQNDKALLTNGDGFNTKNDPLQIPQPPVKRPRGRPRKTDKAKAALHGLNTKNDPLQISQPPVKRPRGRPRKTDKAKAALQNENVQFVLPEIIDETELQITSSSNELAVNVRLEQVSTSTVGGSDTVPPQNCVAQEVLGVGGTLPVNKPVTHIGGQEEFNCSACNIRFKSIYEHIQLFHNKDKVVVELPEAEITEDLRAFQASMENRIAIDIKANEIESVDVKPDVRESSQDSDGSPEQIESDRDAVVPDMASPVQCLNLNPFISTTKKPPSGNWVKSYSNGKYYYQFVNNQVKFKKLVAELKNNPVLHQMFNTPIKNLFENPIINYIEITNKSCSPCFTFKQLDLSTPKPMYIVDRELEADAWLMLGGKASYIIVDNCRSDTTPIPPESKVIAIMKVILGKDKTLSIENIAFKDNMTNGSMIPMLQEVHDTSVPLLKEAKKLIWQCSKCLATTWRFPLGKDSHFCNACSLCHKPFVSVLSLKKHMLQHTKDNSRYCKDCHEVFSDKDLLKRHKDQHENLYFCSICKLFLSKDKEKEHKNLHAKGPSGQLSCSVCLKIFGSSEELTVHENNYCSKLVPKYNCSLCDKKFYSLAAHTYHTVVHTKVSIKFPCRFCPKIFIKEKEQIWHERIHTRERPYLCSAHPKLFRSYPLPEVTQAEGTPAVLLTQGHPYTHVQHLQQVVQHSPTVNDTF